MKAEILNQLYDFSRSVLAPIGRDSYEYGALFDAFALGQVDLVATTLQRFVANHHGKLSLQGAAVLTQLSQSLEMQNTETLRIRLGQVAEWQKSLGLCSTDFKVA